MNESTLRIGVLMPEVLGTYGDGGNAVVLAHRAKLLGHEAEIIQVGVMDPIPDSLDIYTLGGGEDIAQSIASRRLRSDRGFERAVQNGRPVLAICAAFQVLGAWYTDAQGNQVKGAELLDVVTLPQGGRAIGELVGTTQGLDLEAELSAPLTGFENHGGATLLGPSAKPLAFVTHGVGNGLPGVAPELEEGISSEAGRGQGNEPSTAIPQGYRANLDGKAIEGCVQGPIIATYMHGPALARNPQLADLLLSRALGVSLPLSVPEIPGLERLRCERLEAVK